MTDRAKKISQLQTTSSVANTDKLVVLKDAANTSAASTRAMTMNAFAQSIGNLIRLDPANTVVQSNTIIVASNGTSLVPFFTFANNDAGHIEFHAKDYSTGDITAGYLTLVSNSSVANLISSHVVTVGSNPISFNNTPTVNNTSGAVIIYFSRNSAATSNVEIKYKVTLY